MKFHIVQVNEKIKDISKKYAVSVDEIVKLNRHINNIDNIVPGMKLRLPILTDEVSEQLKDNFLDIEKYYPKLEDFKEVKIEKAEEVEEKATPQINVIPQNNQNEPVNQYFQPNYQQPVYQPNYQYGANYSQMYYPNQINQQYQNIPNQINQQYHMPNFNPYLFNRQDDLQNNTNEKPTYIEPNFPKIDKKTLLKQPVEKEKSETLPKNIIEPKPYFYQPPIVNVPNQTMSFVEPVQMSFSQPEKKVENRKPYPFNEEIEQPKVMIDKKLGYEFYPSINQPYFYQQKTPNVSNLSNKTEVFEYDENVKEIKVDLRDVVKHTKIRKKPKDPLDLL